jgi:hypothetical protein
VVLLVVAMVVVVVVVVVLLLLVVVVVVVLPDPELSFVLPLVSSAGAPKVFVPRGRVVRRCYCLLPR